MEVVVSVLMITYNHEAYISQAIEGVLMQKTNFKYELIIADDASNDNNQNIISQLAQKNPDKIKPILRNKNIGMSQNWIDAFNHCTGKYIALCEGDDYWTDPCKLQKQVDFLEANPEYLLCFHNSRIMNENTLSNNLMLPENLKATYTFEDFSKGFIMPPTQTTLFRNVENILDPIFEKRLEARDFSVFYLLSQQGLTKYFQEAMAVRRIQPNGVYSGLDEFNKHIQGIEYRIKCYNFFINDKSSENFLKQVTDKYLILSYISLKELKIVKGFKFYIIGLTYYIRFGTFHKKNLISPIYIYFIEMYKLFSQKHKL